jgi:hypothetical protein
MGESNMKVLVPLIIVPFIILLLSVVALAKTSDVNLNEISIGNQEALSFAHGSATNSIHISDSSKGGSIKECPAAQGDVGWIIGVPADDYGVILHTTDGGKNWTRQGSPETIPNIALNDVRAIDACNAWAVGDADSNYATILKTMDGGKTWTRCGSPGLIPDFSANGIGAVDSRIAWVAGSNGTIIHTVDGGKKLGSSKQVTQMLFYTRWRLWIATTHGLLEMKITVTPSSLGQAMVVALGSGKEMLQMSKLWG